jgi:hypothetical protein
MRQYQEQRRSYNAEYYELDQMLTALRKLPQVCEVASKDVAKGFTKLVSKNIAAGVDPYGHPWLAAQDGLPMLVNADKAVTIEATGTKIEFQVSGPEARHHVGSARGYRGGSKRLGGFRRPLIPWKTQDLPGPFKAVAREVLTKHANAIAKGSNS